MMTLAIALTLLIVAALAAYALLIVRRERQLALSDQSLAPDLSSAPQLSKFQIDRFNQRNFNRWLKTRYKTSEKSGLRAWLSSKIGKLRNEISVTLDELKTQRKRRGGKHSLAYFKPLTASQKRRAARLRRDAIRRSAEFIRKMREEKGLVPVVVTARQRQRAGVVVLDKRGDVLPKGHGSDQILWRDVKASA